MTESGLFVAIGSVELLSRGESIELKIYRGSHSTVIRLTPDQQKALRELLSHSPERPR